MKNLKNLGTILNKNEQKEINGGLGGGCHPLCGIVPGTNCVDGQCHWKL